MKVGVKGAGVAGLALAYELVSRGVQVELLEKHKGLSASASWLAGGMLAPWCERESAEEDVLRLGQTSIGWWSKVLPGQVRHNGTLVVAAPRDTGELSRFVSRTSGFTWLDADALGALEPDLEGRFAKGLHFAGEAHLDPRQALTALQAKLSESGARIKFEAKQFTAATDLVADCTGMASQDTQLRPVRGEMLILHAPDVSLSRPVRFLHPRIPVYVVPRDNGVFMVGATMIESGDRGAVSVRSTMELLNAAYSLHPGFAEAKIIETGAGLRPAYPDNLPRLTFSGNTLSMNGFYRHGFLLAPHFAMEAAHRIVKHLQEKTLEANH
ncbi:THIAMINE BIOSYNTHESIS OXIDOREDUCTASE THIO [Stappia aggregata IAM 12614]|uniref:THIAMINE BIOSYNTHESIS OXIDOREDUCTASE THIO n=1 Tax=Roseibium aggregatum (strain ATCC 25650 / DSM 13394 / JCM 20685 / NBRC 16684 / NCIMB 2208 / IAM 12614 / B1) TaxID=384765 RepID=A0NTS0_ROSAI|nr:glycine oxidase ThiO [Roseibium aggregatum]EAV43829.1 THIAMINE BIOSYNTHESIS OXIDOREDUCTASE THIO [Stappia aggregata IAM 12614] [Roseibium aggregatum IAM 12614]